MSIKREVKEGAQRQGVDEIIAYKITTTPWASTPVVSTVVAYDVTEGLRTDVSATVLQGTASTIGDVITLPSLKSLTADKVYRIEVKFSSSGNTFETFFIVNAEN